MVSSTERHARNTQRLLECNAYLRERLHLVLDALEAEGFHPRIQDAWRSPQDQLAAYQRGTSKLRWGFHNCCTTDGRPDALAVDILDDDHPLQPPLAYLLRLAWHAEQHGLITGICWGLPGKLVQAVEAAIADPEHAPQTLKCGWDPTHVQVACGLTVAQAQQGVRP